MGKLNIVSLKKQARDMGLKLPKEAKKADVIRAIQKAEGNTACFATGKSSCPETRCCWRDDCMSGS